MRFPYFLSLYLVTFPDGSVHSRFKDCRKSKNLSISYIFTVSGCDKLGFWVYHEKLVAGSQSCLQTITFFEGWRTRKVICALINLERF